MQYYIYNTIETTLNMKRVYDSATENYEQLSLLIPKPGQEHKVESKGNDNCEYYLFKCITHPGVQYPHCVALKATTRF